MSFLKRFMFFFDFILPFPLFVLMFYLWYLRTGGSVMFALYVLVLPLVWGYIVPGIGTNVLKLWRFKGRWLMGDYHIHHGFMYAGPLALLLYATFGMGPVSTVQTITIILCTAGVQGLLSSQHDILAMKVGNLEIDNIKARQGKSPEEIVNYLNPFFFFLTGGTYAGSCIYAYDKIMVQNWQSPGEFVILVTVGVVSMSTLPSIPSLAVLAMEKKRGKR